MKFARLESSPKHFIDTSVILGAFSENEKFYEECKAYLNKIGYNYCGFFPTSVVGEIFMIVEERRDTVEKNMFFQFFDRTILRREINFIPPRFESFSLISTIRKVYYKVEPIDAEHLSIAGSMGADAFVTLDTKLVRNRSLENVLGIKILHPKLL